MGSLRSTPVPIGSIMLLVSLVAAACAGTPAVEGDRPAPPDAPDELDGIDIEEPPPEQREERPVFFEPPPIEIVDVERPLTLTPFTYCWTASDPDADEQVGICADGAWPEPIPSAGLVDGDSIDLQFPVADWRFQAWVGTKDNANRRPVGVELVADGEYVIGPIEEPLGPIVEVSGNGPEGDVHIVFAAEWSPPSG